MLRKFSIALLVLGIGLLAAPQFTYADDDQKNEPAPIKLSGKGQQATGKFQLQAGFSNWHFTHDGRSNFIVKLLKTDGSSSDTTLNEIGRYTGSQAVNIPRDGQYLVNVEGDGKWTVTITQPRPNNPPSPPTTFMGKNPSVSPFISLPKGVYTFTMTHKGDSTFRVKILNQDGKYVDQAAGVIGAYNGSKAITIEEAGTYAISVSGNGEWSVKIE